MNLDQLETFLAVARSGSFTKAAPVVHRTQSAVSRQIQELERSLGATLFERLGKQVLLTDAGRIVFDDAPQLLRQAVNLQQRLRDIGRGLSGELRIGATVSAATTFMPDVLARFHRRHSAVSVGLTPGQSEALIAKLRRNEIDVAILGSDVREPDLKIRHRVPDELVLVAAPDNPLVRRKALKPRELEAADFILREPGSDSRRMVEEWLDENRVTVKTLLDLW